MSDIGNDVEDEGIEVSHSAGDINWENAEEELIPFDRSHFTPEAMEATERADAQLEVEEAAMNATISEVEAELDSQVSAEVGEQAPNSMDTSAGEEQDSPESTDEVSSAVGNHPSEQVETKPDSQLEQPDLKPQDKPDDQPQNPDDDSKGFATTELGHGTNGEGAPEMPERTSYHDTIESEDGGSHSPERMG